MGKMVRWTRRGGWSVGPTPFQYRLAGLYFFKRLEFNGLRSRLNARRRPRYRRLAHILVKEL
jgi:hypothetical protein